MNKHPLSHISPQSRPAVFTVLLAAILLNLTDSPRRTDEASAGIISYELDRTEETVASILNSFDNLRK